MKQNINNLKYKHLNKIKIFKTKIKRGNKKNKSF